MKLTKEQRQIVCDKNIKKKASRKAAAFAAGGPEDKGITIELVKSPPPVVAEGVMVVAPAPAPAAPTAGGYMMRVKMKDGN